MTALPDIFSELNADQENLLRVIYNPAQEAGRWPNWRWVDGMYRGQTGKDTRDILGSLPIVWPVSDRFKRYGLVKYDDQEPRDGTVMRLTVAAALHLPEFRKVGENFIQVLQALIDQSMLPPRDPFEVEPLVITNEDLWLEHRIPLSPVFDRLMPDLLWNEPISLATSLGRGPTNGAWQLTLNRDGLRQVQEVKNLRDYVERVVAWVRRMPDVEVPRVVAGAPIAVSSPARPSYVDQALLEKLEAAQAGTKWNLKKLLQLLGELNDNFDNENVYSCHALLRAILDHLPPIFGHGTFGAVIDQYAWGRTDKNYMKRLGEFRAQGDDTMHRPVGRREDTLSFHDLPARAAVNRLVSEVVVILESEAPSA